MYSRRVGDETLAFGHEGILYKRSFVMYDRSTKSLWVHVTGEAVKGKRKGAKLAFLPSVITTWGDWKKRHPLTTVLEGRAARGFMGSYTLGERPERFGLSVGEGKDVKLHPIADLEKRGVLTVGEGAARVVVVYDKATRVGRAYRTGGRKLERKDEVLVDGKGGEWDWFTGLPKGNGDPLVPVPATIWLLDRWKAHHEKR